MKIILTDGYYITNDEMNIFLKRTRETEGKRKNEGKKVVVDETIGYFATVQNALKRYMHDVSIVKSSDFIGTIEQYCEWLDKSFDVTARQISDLLERKE